MSSSNNEVIVKIEFCGGWGYSYYFRQLAEYLAYMFPTGLKIIPQQDMRTTGNFEVTIVNTNKLIHSKKTKRQGYCESESERQAVVKEIKEAFAALNIPIPEPKKAPPRKYSDY